MITLRNIGLKLGHRQLFEGASLAVGPNQRVGVVGPNGAGKTTLFRLMTGELPPDAGEVSIVRGASVGIVRQNLPDDDTPLIDLVLAADTERHALLAEAETATDPYRISEIEHRLLDIGAAAAPARAASILTGLGFKPDELTAPIRNYSGGWRMRVALAAVLFKAPDVLLLDEPSNHLDLEAMIWLEDYLARFPGTLLLISHDRALLNRVVTRIAHVDDGKIELYTGTYDQFEETRAQKRANQQALFDKQQAERARIQAFVDRFRAKASKARQAQSRIKALERMTLVDAVMAERAITLRFPSPESLPPPLLALNRVDAGYDHPVLKRLNLRLDADDRIALLGQNGNGKSTLLKILAGRLAPLAGERVASPKLRVGYFAQHQTEEIPPGEPAVAILGRALGNPPEVTVRSRLGQFGFDKARADTLVQNLSGGEKARLLFAVMTAHTPHILLLDEPTNHLDMDTREALVRAIGDYEGAVILVSHDPDLVDRVADRLWKVADGTCADYDGTLETYRDEVMRARRSGGKPADDTPKPKALPADARKKVKKLDDLLDRLAAQKNDLENQLADPALYADAHTAKSLQAAYRDVQAKIAAAEEEWLALQMA
jgi:ATP-binding cassette subfamily F protein 3